MKEHFRRIAFIGSVTGLGFAVGCPLEFFAFSVLAVVAITLFE